MSGVDRKSNVLWTTNRRNSDRLSIDKTVDIDLEDADFKFKIFDIDFDLFDKISSRLTAK